MAENRRGHQNPITSVQDSFKLVVEAHRQSTEVAESAKDAVKTFYKDVEDLALFIERHQTPVYVLGGLLPQLVLWLLGFQPGFVPPVDNKRYERLKQFLTWYEQVFCRRPRLKEKLPCDFRYGVFVLDRALFSVGFLSHQLHHWLAYRSGMAGYCERAQKLYRRFWNEGGGVIGDEVYEMSVEDLLALKAAINRDLEALMFLREVVREILVPARQSARLAQGKASA